MKVIERYIFKESLGYFFISLVAFTSVLLSVRILRFTSLIVNKGVEFSQIATVFLAIIPTFMEYAVPMAALLGCVLAIARLSGDSEIVVLRASGISILQLIRPVLLFGLLVTIIAYSLSFYFRPWGYKKLDQTLFEIAQSKTTSGLESGVFNQLGNLVVYADQVNYQNGQLANVLVDDRRSENERKIIIAASGLITSDKDSYEILIQLENGTIHEKTGAKYSVTQFITNYLRIDANELMGRGKRKENQKVNQYTTQELYNEIKARSNSAITEIAQPESIVANNSQIAEEKKVRPISELKFELAKRLALPFASLLMALIGLPLGIQPPRLQKTWGAPFSMCLGLLIFALYFGLLSFASAFGDRGQVNALLAAWLPNLSILVLAIFLLHRVGTERWQSVAHGLEKMSSFFTQLRPRFLGAKA